METDFDKVVEMCSNGTVPSFFGIERIITKNFMKHLHIIENFRCDEIGLIIIVHPRSSLVVDFCRGYNRRFKNVVIVHENVNHQTVYDEYEFNIRQFEVWCKRLPRDENFRGIVIVHEQPWENYVPEKYVKPATVGGYGLDDFEEMEEESAAMMTAQKKHMEFLEKINQTRFYDRYNDENIASTIKLVEEFITVLTEEALLNFVFSGVVTQEFMIHAETENNYYSEMPPLFESEPSSDENYYSRNK